jgi:mono/diheme cytochrome c family protein
VLRTKSLLLLTAVTIPAAAFTFGGWAVTTVEDVPEYAVAGKPFDVTYTVRQHGFSLVTRLAGVVTVLSGSRAKDFGAVELGEGMYRSKVTIPEAGDWDLTVSTGFMKAGITMPLEVVAANAPAPPPMSAHDRGRQLFVAKGCVTCHTHQLTKGFNSTNLGPDLSEPKFTAAYLARFLANPSIKTDWRSPNRMPDLGLRPAEIGALVAFLNQEKK